MSAETKVIEYRVGWSAGSNASFKGRTNWEPWDGFEETAEEVEKAAEAGDVPQGLARAIEASGFEWWVETRVVSGNADDGR